MAGTTKDTMENKVSTANTSLVRLKKRYYMHCHVTVINDNL